MTGDARAALERARMRLDSLSLYPTPVRTERVRIVTAPWLFRLPRLQRYQGYALWRTILLRRPVDFDPGSSDDLICHELCHIWQGQHRPLHMLWTYATTRYRENPYEAQARAAVARTRR